MAVEVVEAVEAEWGSGAVILLAQSRLIVVGTGTGARPACRAARVKRRASARGEQAQMKTEKAAAVETARLTWVRIVQIDE